jgi:hypothetical protein
MAESESTAREEKRSVRKGDQEMSTATTARLAYPDSGHGSLFQFHDSFTRHATAFIASDSPFAPY